mmetsp:Transcript_46051/g.82909  ORF Transcript_46051/g.82909 Transcript_46051/m.82909 type:complete len:277 (-) Transcript_46051:608-1438(-)
MCLSIILAFFLIKLTLLLSSGILVLLVLGDEVIHVGLSLGELHLVHALSGVPVQECLAAEHGSEVLGHTLEHLLDGSGVSSKGHSHFEPLWWNIANTTLDVVGDPLAEVGRVLVLHVQDLLIHLLGGHAATEETSSCEVAAVARICSAHHVLGIEHLLSELRHGESTVLLRASGSEWCEASHVEVQTREWHQVHSHLTEVTVELSREAKTAGSAGESCRDEVVQISVRWSGKFQSAETDIVECLVVQEVAGVGVLDKLVEAQHSVVWLNNSVRDFW